MLMSLFSDPDHDFPGAFNTKSAIFVTFMYRKKSKTKQTKKHHQANRQIWFYAKQWHNILRFVLTSSDIKWL